MNDWEEIEKLPAGTVLMTRSGELLFKPKTDLNYHFDNLTVISLTHGTVNHLSEYIMPHKQKFEDVFRIVKLEEERMTSDNVRQQYLEAGSRTRVYIRNTNKEKDQMAQDALKLIDPEWHEQFLWFVKTGVAQEEFIQYLDSDKECHDVVIKIFNRQVKRMEGLADRVEATLASFPKKLTRPQE